MFRKHLYVIYLLDGSKLFKIKNYEYYSVCTLLTHFNSNLKKNDTLTLIQGLCSFVDGFIVLILTNDKTSKWTNVICFVKLSRAQLSRVRVKIIENDSLYYTHRRYVMLGFPRKTHRLIVLSRVSGLAGPLMYLFPNCTALPRGQPADERLGGTIDITAVCSDAILNPDAKVCSTHWNIWLANNSTATQSLWTLSLNFF